MKTAPSLIPPLDMSQPRARQGPRPLALHLMTTLCAWLSLPTAWPSLKSVSSSLKPDLAAHLSAHQALPGNLNADFVQALSDEAAARVLGFIKGVRLYQNHAAKRDVPEAPVIFQLGSTRLRDYNPHADKAPLVLIVPSLINRYDILDLDHKFSFLRAMAEAGFRPLLVDWDQPGTEETEFDISAYVTQRLVPLFEFTASLKRDSHILGYCMGGLLTLALASLTPHPIKSLTLLGTPWDFHAPDVALTYASFNLNSCLEPILRHFGYLPVDVLQSLFASAQPLQTMNKFSAFSSMDPQSSEARKFVLLEDWLNNGVPLTAAAARECFQGWYDQNKPARYEWQIQKQTIDPRKLTLPAYAVIAGRDLIVPPASSLPLAHLLPNGSLHEPMLGHIGMIASRSAPQRVWNPLFRWLHEHT